MGRTTAVAAVLGILVGVSALATRADEAAGTVAVSVRLQGSAPAAAPRPIESAEHRTSCGRETVPSETLVVSAEGGVLNALVTLELKEGETPAPAAPAEAVLFDQTGCVFTGHVLVVPVGAQVRFKNSDSFPHNVQASSRRNPAFNETVPANGELVKTFARAERIQISCTIHPFMSAWLVVVDTPYWALTDASGNCTIPDVPPGTYKVKFWHENRDYTETGPAEVTVAAGGSVPVAFTLAHK